MRTAVVVGAGMAGLATAGALSRSGWQVTLLERGERVAAPPTALVLWSNGRRALEALDPDGGWSAIAAALPDGGVRRPDGQWLVEPRARLSSGAGPAPAAVHLEDLYDALVAGLGDRVEIRTGFDVTSVRVGPGRRPSVGDGRTQLEADLVVAADGIDSPVRRALAPESVAVGSGFAAWQAVIPAYRAPRLTDEQKAGGETLGAGYRFVSIPLGDRAAGRGGIYWVATAAGAPRPEPPATQLALLRRWFAGWHPPVRELLEATDPGDLVPQEVRELRPLPRAYGFRSGPGGVVLLGDAAHAMPHHLGQGACLAFEDAATLRPLVADAAPGEQLIAAIEAYSRLRRPRTTSVVRQTRRMSAVVQARGRLALRARDAALNHMRPRILGGHAHGPTDWTPPEC
ncbi:MAG TPA: NAD(P)/FAD-dependent oxidoreductase [Actinoplanes sp.]|nr:NAD(P)/FAD-dependent oxidoreductase [Actinoplanes sp.]